MKIFVVSWFYVPKTTSEALVTYKLLANSKNEYYVCSAASNKWSYKVKTNLESKNIKQIIIDTEDFNEFIEKAYNEYLKLSKKIKFDCIMTRSLPPESQYVGLKIKEQNPNIPWIASLADPIGNNPYETFYYFLNNRHRLVRSLYYYAPHFFLDKVAPLIRKKHFQKLVELNKLEKKVLKKADIIITPNVQQAKFIMYNNDIYNKKSLVIPHSYDESLYNHKIKKNDKFTFAFVGQSDNLRSLKPIVKAVKMLKDLNSNIIDKIHFRFVGNVPKDVENMVYVYFLQDIISIESSCDYFTSLDIMESADCLIHIDASFNFLPNESIFFAAKIVDYLGSKKPILGITNEKSPAGEIILKCGGVCSKNDPYEIAINIINIFNNGVVENNEEREKYEAKVVAKYFDEQIDRRLNHEEK